MTVTGVILTGRLNRARRKRSAAASPAPLLRVASTGAHGRGERARYDGAVNTSPPRRRRAFDLGLFIAILASVVAVILESVAGIRREYGTPLRAVEWALTVLFTVEYVLRLLTCAG